ncbi:4-(cytidine 5'-diphospho)-2-C-methyl-D-erythritol kinase [Brevibacterium paucivorans]
MTAVTARAPGKINVFLHVGDRMDDGYHELVTVFQALDMYEEVTLRLCFDQPDTVVRNISGNDTYPGLSPVHAVTLKGRFGSTAIPLDHSNLAVSAINRLAAQTGVHVPVEVEIEKNVPVAGGMGGGSADAAAALVAYAKLAGINDPDRLRTVGAELGADVPFALRGGFAVGTGRGDELSPILSSGEFTWVLATSVDELSTPVVYHALDDLRDSGKAPHAGDVQTQLADVLQAVGSGDAHALAQVVHNDMEPAAFGLLPAIAEVVDTGRQAGALAALMSGSGPTVGFLVEGATHALDLTVLLEASESVKHVVRATGPACGAHIVTPG